MRFVAGTEFAGRALERRVRRACTRTPVADERNEISEAVYGKA